MGQVIGLVLPAQLLFLPNSLGTSSGGGGGGGGGGGSGFIIPQVKIVSHDWLTDGFPNQHVH